MSIPGNRVPTWHARLNQHTGLVLCGYPRCDGELGYATMDESGVALGLVIPPGFEPFTRKGIWRLSNYARGRRPERGQTVRHRRYTAPSMDGSVRGGAELQQSVLPVRVECPKCRRVNIADADHLRRLKPLGTM